MANSNTQGTNGNNGLTTTSAEKEKNAFQRAGDATFRKWQQFKTSKLGRWTLRLTKAAALAAGGYACYKEGQKSVKPTTIYIQEGTGEVIQPENQEPVQEEPVQAEA